MNKENSDTYSVTCRCPRLLVFVLAAALVFGAVCVGGVSADTYYVGSQNPGNLGPGEHKYSSLSEAISAANNNAGADTIVITSDIEVAETCYITSDITITNWKNLNVRIESGISQSLFSVSYPGNFVLTGTGSGSLTLDGNSRVQWSNGGAVFVGSGSFEMNDGVTITDFGWLGTGIAGDGAVYVDSGKFTMNGGNITNCKSAKGSGVYVGSYATFEMTGGEITANGHKGYTIIIFRIDETYGGGVFVEDNGVLISSGDKTLDEMIHDNLGRPQYVYNNPDRTRYYIVKHFFYDIDGNNPVENKSLRQTAAGNWDELTNAKPYSITGYVNDTITQKTIANNIVNEIVDDTKTTVVEVYYRVSISYEITIPANLIIAEDTKTGTLPITPTELWILETGSVVVSVSSENNFNLVYVDDADFKVSYELKDGDRVIKQNDNVAEFTLANPDAVSISAKLTGHPPYVGTYSDLLTFTAEYVDPAFS